ncbi:hypothetical protein [Paenibacillus sp. NPDC058177]|uniref:hypothetical protein n=1 Tax=Paenibacillus sp. NPDC058177 TaxID=3346369 RepID=UPI0036DF0B29
MANGMYGGGDGSANKPYLIEDAYDLFEFLNKVDTINTNMSAKLVNDIDLNVLPYNTGVGFFIKHNTPFMGTFDGDGYLIKNYFSRPNANYSGLFPYIGATGVVKNFGMENVDIQATAYTYQSAICGYMGTGGSIENVYVKGGRFYVNSNSGAIIGHLVNGLVRNVYVLDVDIRQYGSYVGGVMGYMTASSSLLYNVWASNTASNMSHTSYFGGVVGGISGVSPQQMLNVYQSSRISNLGYSVTTGMVTLYPDSTLKDPNYMFNLNANQGSSANTYWVVQPVTFPKLWFEDFRAFLMLDAGRPISNIDFGAVLEGGNSTIKKVRLKNGYKYKIKGIDVGWVRADGVSTKTELEFSMDGTFKDNYNPMSVNNLNILPGREFDLFVRVKTQIGVTGAGQFNITVTVTSAE